VCASFVGILPLAHLAISKGTLLHPRFLLILTEFGLSIGLYVLGASFYVSRIPERFFPTTTTFDLCFASHQVWHVFVILGALAHYYAVHRIYALTMNPVK